MFQQFFEMKAFTPSTSKKYLSSSKHIKLGNIGTSHKHRDSAVARVSEAPPEISRGAPHTLLAYYYELQ